MVVIHDLKTWPHEFEAVRRGDKPFEVRRNTDRSFGVGDELRLRKWDPAGVYAGYPTGAYLDDNGYYTANFAKADTERRRVTYVLHGGRFGLPPGVCVMGIAPIDEVEDKQAGEV